MFGNKPKDEKPVATTQPTQPTPDANPVQPAAQQSPRARLEAELAALGCDTSIVRITSVTVRCDAGDVGGQFSVTVDGDIGNDEADAIIARAKAELPIKGAAPTLKINASAGDANG